MHLSEILAEGAELPEHTDYDQMDTLTLRMLRDSTRRQKDTLAKAYMSVSDGGAEELKAIAARLRRINAALDRKDGLD